MTISAMYFIYGAPFEIVIASLFLYNLLGLSAFAGFLVLLLGWPLNSYIVRRNVSIQKGWLAARDKRMGVLSELVGAVKFVKFFAWEERWIQVVMGTIDEGCGDWVDGQSENEFGRVLAAVHLCPDINFDHFVMQGNELFNLLLSRQLRCST